MYESYWLLDKKPFENTPDPRFMYQSDKHEEALMRMLYTVYERKEGTLLTGEYGSGKTILSRALLKELERDDRYKTVLVLNPKISHHEFLKEILYQLGLEQTATDKLTLQHQVGEAMGEIADAGKSTVIILDEAQVLNTNDFDELRLLLNFGRPDRFLFTLILIGHTDLKKKVFSVEPLKQRLATRFHLSALDENETAQYITHRLAVAGRSDSILTPEALHLVYRGAEGIPRRINNICDYCLLIGYSRRADKIGTDIVIDALKDLDEWRENMSEVPVLSSKDAIDDSHAPVDDLADMTSADDSPLSVDDDVLDEYIKQVALDVDNQADLKDDVEAKPASVTSLEDFSKKFVSPPDNSLLAPGAMTVNNMLASSAVPAACMESNPIAPPEQVLDAEASQFSILHAIDNQTMTVTCISCGEISRATGLCSFSNAIRQINKNFIRDHISPQSEANSQAELLMKIDKETGYIEEIFITDKSGNIMENKDNYLGLATALIKKVRAPQNVWGNGTIRVPINWGTN